MHGSLPHSQLPKWEILRFHEVKTKGFGLLTLLDTNALTFKRLEIESVTLIGGTWGQLFESLLNMAPLETTFVHSWRMVGHDGSTRRLRLLYGQLSELREPRPGRSSLFDL